MAVGWKGVLLSSTPDRNLAEYPREPRWRNAVWRSLKMASCRRSQGSARILRAVSGILPGTSVSGWPREVQPNIRATPHSSDVEVLMTVGRMQMLSALPPDPPLRRHPTLTRLGLVQRWAVLEIPTGDQLRTGAGASRWSPRNRCHPLAQSKFFLEEDGATSPTLTSFQRVYVGYGCWRFLLRRSCGGLSHSRFLGRH
jgi:hypothetical protein